MKRKWESAKEERAVVEGGGAAEGLENLAGLHNSGEDFVARVYLSSSGGSRAARAYIMGFFFSVQLRKYTFAA